MLGFHPKVFVKGMQQLYVCEQSAPVFSTEIDSMSLDVCAQLCSLFGGFGLFQNMTCLYVVILQQMLHYKLLKQTSQPCKQT